MDDDIPDAWTCQENVWDRAHNSCTIPQALSDEQIDEILMQQVRRVVCWLRLIDHSWPCCHL